MTLSRIIEMRNRAIADRWCILRTSPGRTLALAASLAEAGFDVWSPARIVRRRRPRSTKTTELSVPIMPTFVFARASQISELNRFTTMPISPHPAFTIFRHAGRIPLIAESEIAGARAVEAQALLEHARTTRRVFRAGTKVNVDNDAFTGLEGVVEEGGNGKFALVTFGGAMTFSIATFLLTTEDVEAATTRAAA